MKYEIFSWNVNGLRAVLRKNALQELIEARNPDILCLQETKAKPGQAETDLPEYEEIWNSAARPGYSGTAIFTKTPPLKTINGFPEDLNAKFEEKYATLEKSPAEQKTLEKHGSPLTEGRVLTAEYPEFFLVTVYTPNSKPDLSRLELREKIWDPLFLEYLKRLETEKPVVVCGDFNAAHTEIDLARPKQNERNAGYTKEERQGITNLIKANLLDTFREKHPAEKRYTWWSHWGRARENNIGWRIDYFFISKSLEKNLKTAEIYESHLGSDHCPISITLEF